MRNSIPLLFAVLALGACKKEEATTAPDEAPPAEDAAEDDELPPIDEGPSGLDNSEPEPVLSAASFENAVNDHMQEVVDCYAEAQSKNKKLEGTMQARFTISGEGKVEKVEAADGSTLADDGLTACIETAAQNWQFDPTPSGESMHMEFPFNLAPG